jgi:hypothetical protein
LRGDTPHYPSEGYIQVVLTHTIIDTTFKQLEFHCSIVNGNLLDSLTKINVVSKLS